ncbi:hypothetical protein ACFFS2_08775 [Streptomyces aurantiacus]|uniref:Type IV secretion system protein n=2 Tax=Streptomyces aurantiacus TaxID=47760 RepID=A0A7G1NX81_9ACTN|nr:hypothetical protein [Streptomyces aurantiacus]BCL25525.1 hypothetical protein GCM10017557_03840 [Streptomyces aurantiacus]
MFLAAAGDGCDGGLDFLGMFGDPIGTMINMVAKIVINGAIGIFQSVGGIDSTNDEAAAKISNQTRWITVYLACGSILFAAAKMALDRRGESGQTAVKGVLRVLLVSTAATALIGTFVDLMDRYSQHLLRGSLINLMEGIDCNGGVPDMLLLVIGCLLIISGIIHALLMWIRLGVMVMLMGTLPMAAAASMTDWGGTWWRKHIGWMTAWLLYKPTVGLVLYSGAIMVDASETNSTGANTNNADTQIAGMGLLLLSAIALPALMKLIVPATAALGGDSAGDATMGIAGGLASGAKSLADSSGRNEDGGPSGSQSPSGSNEGGGSESGSGGGGSGGGGSESGGGSEGGSGGGSGGGSSEGAESAGAAESGASAGASKAAAGANPVVMALEVAQKVGKGVADVAKSGVEGADGERK